MTLEEAIKEIQKVVDECPWPGTVEEHKQLLAWLKDYQTMLQKPERKTFHVIDKQTGKEADPYEIALNEEWAKGLMYCDMEGFAILEDGTLMLTDECGKYEFPPDQERFIVEWE